MRAWVSFCKCWNSQHTVFHILKMAGKRIRKKELPMKKTLLCIATLDTKGPEAMYVKNLIERRGCTPLILDISMLGEAYFPAEIPAERVAKSAGSTIEEVRAFRGTGQAAEIMIAGVRTIVGDLYYSGKIHGVISIGGGVGSAVASAGMRELPIGFPKLMLSTQKVVQAGIRGYVGTKDIAILPSPADIAGLNRITMKMFNNAVSATIGMIESSQFEIAERPLVFMSMLGSTAKCGLKVKSLLEHAGFEVITIHVMGLSTTEELVENYPAKGNIELALHEVGCALFGGRSAAGPDRLVTIGERGIPQIITPGNVEFINFLGPETVPNHLKNRLLHVHSPQSTVMRLNAEELKLVGEEVARRLNRAKGPLKVLIPTRGFSLINQEGNIFYDPLADEAFIDSLKKNLKKPIEIREIDAHINDEKFAMAVMDEFLNII